MEVDHRAVRWLLASGDPSLRYFTLTELLDRPAGDPEVQAARQAIAQGPIAQALLAGQQPDGGFGVHPYQKWTGAHWRLVSLVELGIPAGEPRACAAAGQVLGWLTGEGHRRGIQSVSGRVRRCASQEGNALAVCSRLGLAGEPSVQLLARSLVEWQWPDGGWNCDKNPGAWHSSFHESLAPLWGLIEFFRATGDPHSREAIERARELFLSHRLFRSDRTGEIIHPEWLKLHYPPYWHYDVLQGLLVLSRGGPLCDPRLQEALDLIEAKRLPGGCWKAEGYYWRPPGTKGSNVEVVDWGRRGFNPWITLNALRVLKSGGRS
jgi:hypothetical protein